MMNVDVDVDGTPSATNPQADTQAHASPLTIACERMAKYCRRNKLRVTSTSIARSWSLWCQLHEDEIQEQMRQMGAADQDPGGFFWRFAPQFFTDGLSWDLRAGILGRDSIAEQLAPCNDQRRAAAMELLGKVLKAAVGEPCAPGSVEFVQMIHHHALTTIGMIYRPSGWAWIRAVQVVGDSYTLTISKRLALYFAAALVYGFMLADAEADDKQADAVLQKAVHEAKEVMEGQCVPTVICKRCLRIASRMIDKSAGVIDYKLLTMRIARDVARVLSVFYDRSLSDPHCHLLALDNKTLSMLSEICGKDVGDSRWNIAQACCAGGTW